MSRPLSLSAAVRDAARATDWSVFDGTLTTVRDGIGWHVYSFADEARVMAKPVAWDAALWSLFDVPKRRSPTFHFRSGSVVVPVLWTADGLPDGPDARAEALIALAEEALSARPVSFAFPAFARRDATGRPESHFVIAEAAAALETGQTAAARRTARDVIEGRRAVSYRLSLPTGSGTVDVFERMDRVI